MAIRRIRIDYTVYRPNHQRGEPCWDFRTLRRAKTAARGLGSGSRIYRNFNQTNKRSQILGDWWSGKYFWTWDGMYFSREIDTRRFNGSEDAH
jgi:hypothetical protein